MSGTGRSRRLLARHVQQLALASAAAAAGRRRRRPAARARQQRLRAVGRWRSRMATRITCSGCPASSPRADSARARRTSRSRSSIRKPRAACAAVRALLDDRVRRRQLPAARGGRSRPAPTVPMGKGRQLESFAVDAHALRARPRLPRRRNAAPAQAGVRGLAAARPSSSAPASGRRDDDDGSRPATSSSRTAATRCRCRPTRCAAPICSSTTPPSWTPPIGASRFTPAPRKRWAWPASAGVRDAGPAPSLDPLRSSVRAARPARSGGGQRLQRAGLAARRAGRLRRDAMD